MTQLCTESHDQVLLQYYKVKQTAPQYTVSPPSSQYIGALPQLLNRPSRIAAYSVSNWPLITQSRLQTPSSAKPKPAPSKKPSCKLLPLEKESTKVAMKISQCSGNWEALVNQVNESIRDAHQQQMLGRYMIEKMQREQTSANIPTEQAARNKEILKGLINKYGNGLENIVTKEREFERLIEAYQVFVRGEKRKNKKKRVFKTLKTEEPLPAISDHKAGRSQVGCKIRHELRKEYDKKLRQQKSKKLKENSNIQQAANLGKDEGKDKDTGDGEVEELIAAWKEEEDLEEKASSELSLTFVPSENGSVALLSDADDELPIQVQKAEKAVVLKEVPKEAVLAESESENKAALADQKTVTSSEDSVSEHIATQSLEPVLHDIKLQDNEAIEVDNIKEAELEITSYTKTGVTKDLVEDSNDEPNDSTLAVKLEVKKPVETEDEYAIEAVRVVNEVLESLDSEHSEGAEELNWSPTSTELVPHSLSTGTKAEEKKLIHFKSSPEIVYYEKSSAEADLAGCADDKLILAEDLRNAEAELDETSKALYHRVLSTLESEGINKNHFDDANLRALSRQISDTAINNVIDKDNEEKREELIAATAKELAESVIKSVVSG